MSVSAIIDEEVEDFKLELTWKDTVSGVTSAIATFIMQRGWSLAGALYSICLPLHSARYGQTTSKVQEVFRRLFCLVWAPPFAMVPLAFTSVSAFLTLFTRSYRTTIGSFKEEVTGQKLFTLNPQMGPGFLPSRNVGLVSSGERLGRLVATVRDNDPDIVFLPGVHTTCAGKLASQLKDRYHFIFSAMGPKCFDFDAGLFVAFRGKLVRTPEYIPFNHQKGGYFMFETPDTLYLCAESPSLESLQEMCSREGKKVVFMGNIEQNSPEFSFLVEKGFVSVTDGVTETNAPYIDFHKKEEPVTEKRNGVLFVKEGSMEAKILPMHKEGFIDQALSNHSAVLA